MAAAFDRAGFEAVDVHMSDLIAGRTELAAFNGLVACGGFSYGDVLGAGRGWATSILEREALRDAVRRVLRARRQLHAGRVQRLPDAQPAEGADSRRRALAALPAQPQRAVRSASVAWSKSSSHRRCCCAGMAGSRIPVVVSHGEGRAEFGAGQDAGAGACRAALHRQPRRPGRRIIRPTRTARRWASPA